MTATRRSLYLLALAALLLRLALLPWFDRVEPKIYDERDYMDIATNLAVRGEFAMHGAVSSARPPLYPAMVSLVYRVAGVGEHQAVRLLQIVLNVALVPLVFALGRRLYDERTGVWAAGITVFYPSLWGHDYLLLTEVLFTLLLTAGTVALVAFVARDAAGPAPVAESGPPHWAMLVAAGIAFGLATLTRTTLLFYPPLLAVALFGWWRVPSRRRIAAVTLFFAVFALTLAPWIARNSRLHGRLSSIDSSSGMTAVRFSPLRHLLTDANKNLFPRRSLSGNRDGTAGRGAARPASERQVRSGPGTSAAGGDSAGRGVWVPIRRMARASIGVGWDALLFWRIDRELVGAAARGWLGPIPRPAIVGLALVIAGYYVALMLLGVAGVVLRPPAERVHLAIVLSVVVVVAGVHAFTIGHSRYHVPLMPLVALFAARLVVMPRAAVTRRRMAAAVTAVALLVGAWTAAFVRDDLHEVRSRLGLGGGPPSAAR